MSTANDLPDTLLTIIVIFVILFVGGFAANAVILGGTGGGQADRAVLLDGTTWVDIGDHTGTNEKVYDSLGYAINTTGASDSSWQSTQDVEIATDDTWTVSLWAAVDGESAAQNMTVVSVNGRIVVVYNGTADEWQAWYYDDGARDSYQVNVSAPDQPGNLTNIVVTRNATTLAIYRNTTLGSTADLTNSSGVDAPVEAVEFDGRTDEVRTFDDALNASQRDDLYTDPVGPLPFTNRTARVMFDQPDRKFQLLFFAGGDISTSNVTYGDGLDGQQLNAESLYNAITDKTDYQWDVVGPRIRPVEDGRLEYAPVAYVEYTRQSQLDTLADDWNTAIGIAAILFILLPVGVIIGYLQLGRRR